MRQSNNPFSNLSARREDVSSHPDLAALASRLDGLLLPVMRQPIHVPGEKALLSQNGGVCEADGARLVFDPFEPEDHRCPVCNNVYAGSRHHRAWVWRYHLWLSERVVHGALLDAVGPPNADRRRWTEKVLESYAVGYWSYDNADNVLGPTRLFFSTYMESIWLLQILIAAMILSSDGQMMPTGLRHAIESLADESSTLIASFEEGRSNRQVWNASAVLAAGLFLDDTRRVDWALAGRSGVESLLRKGVSKNGRWHEGENYHLFALRGFLFAAELASAVGLDLYDRHESLGKMFSAPLATMLPDFTLAARGDSPYGVSVRQPRFAELWEIGYARTGEERLAEVLAELYQYRGPQVEIGMAAISEVEQNRDAMQLTRKDLSWKALLWMNPSQQFESGFARSGASTVAVEPDGPVVIRTIDGRHVAVEASGTGTGHGHPDRLHLTLFDRAPVLADFGTGSYVDESLFWYRSWRSHNVPEVVGGDGRSGLPRLVAYDQHEDWHWCHVSLTEFAGKGSSADRFVVVGPQYVIDAVVVDVPEETVVELPIHLLGYTLPEPVAAEPKTDADRISSLDGDRGDVFLLPRVHETRRVEKGPGPPPTHFGRAELVPFVVRRCAGPGIWVQVFAKRPDSVSSASFDDHVISIQSDSGNDVISLQRSGVELRSGARVIRLSGRVEAVHAARKPTPVDFPTYRCRVFSHTPTVKQIDELLALGEPLTERSYRKSEREYPGSGLFSARWAAYVMDERIVWVIDVHKADLTFRPHDATDPKLDNESPDIHSDGLQIYFSDPFDADTPMSVWQESWRGFTIVPDEQEPNVARVRPVDASPRPVEPIEVEASIMSQGFRVQVTSGLGAPLDHNQAVAFTFAVNEMYPNRMRRAGQLALGGGGWVYLRGNRESPLSATLCVPK